MHKSSLKGSAACLQTCFRELKCTKGSFLDDPRQEVQGQNGLGLRTGLVGRMAWLTKACGHPGRAIQKEVIMPGAEAGEGPLSSVKRAPSQNTKSEAEARVWNQELKNNRQTGPEGHRGALRVNGGRRNWSRNQANTKMTKLKVVAKAKILQEWA